MSWGSLAYWRSNDWKRAWERLKDETEYNPPADLLFAALRAVHPDTCRVAILGQDPYPNHHYCTGLAFSVPSGLRKLPPTLVNIFKEYQDDLGYPMPENGDLTKWCERGVLLWNVYPSCAIGRPGSHHWSEWESLTKEIVEKLDAKEIPVVFIFLGKSAAAFCQYVHKSPVIVTSHPSPLGAGAGFIGSKVFTRTNLALSALNLPPINWMLS